MQTAAARPFGRRNARLVTVPTAHPVVAVAAREPAIVQDRPVRTSRPATAVSPIAINTALPRHPTRNDVWPADRETERPTPAANAVGAAILFHIATAIIAAIVGLTLAGIVAGKAAMDNQTTYFVGLIHGLVALVALPLLLKDGEEARNLFHLREPIDRQALLRIIIICGLVLLVIGSLSAWSIQNSTKLTEQHLGDVATAAKLSGAHWWIYLVCVVVMAPIVEELLFRGYLLTRLTQSVSTRGAVIASSAVFAVMHINYPPLTMAVIFCLGVALAKIRLKTKSIWPSVALHMAWNGQVALLAVYAAAAGKV